VPAHFEPGEIWLEVDDGVLTKVGRGDTVVQNGTRHAWRNRGTAPATLAVVRSGRRGPDDGGSFRIMGVLGCIVGPWSWYPVGRDRAEPMKASSSDTPPMSGSTGGVQVIARVAQVFRALDGERQGLSLAQLANRLDLPRSTVHRIVTALAAEGLLANAAPVGRIRIGPEFARLATANRLELWEQFEPFMRRISEDLGETVDCAILEGQRVKVIHVIPTKHRLRAVADVGATFPLHCSAKGKAILAHFDDDKVRKLLPARLERVTDKTDTSLDGLLAELAQVRATGVAYNREEATVGICSAAIAVREPGGAIIAMSVPVPTQRYLDDEEAITRVMTDVRGQVLAAFGS
jgi:DNA-binding IclR family transcriptional regulator